jgi:hypothetical protein
MSRFYLGLDLGQAQDWTALAIVERLKSPEREGGNDAPPPPWVYHLRHLERVPLGTPYPAIVDRVCALLATSQLSGVTDLVVDATGVGRPVVDLLRAARLRPTAVTITSGDVETRDGSDWRVPKRDLVIGLQVLLQTDVLKVADGLREWPTGLRELLAFKVKIDPLTAHDSYGYAREGVHDDLVLAVALACWRARKAAYAPSTPMLFPRVSPRGDW